MTQTKEIRMQRTKEKKRKGKKYQTQFRWTTLMIYNLYLFLYRNLTPWMWLTTVFAFGNSPLTSDGHVLLVMLSLYFLVTVVVCTGYDFERASIQVTLLEIRVIRENHV